MAPRLQKLLDSAGSPERRADIALAVKRLIDPLGMGGQYKIMGLSAGATGEVYPFPVEQSDEPTPTEEVQGDSEQPSAATSKRPSSEVQ
jgi:NADH dehydrogenase [ubiquinone] 1 alpha subcomplex assembly factor 7